jgi:hypothetical protein
MDQGLERFVPMSASQDLQLDAYSKAWNVVSPIDATSSVLLPDATDLENGYQIVIHNIASDSIPVQFQDASELQSLAENDAYLFTLYDNGTANGLWHVNLLEDASGLVAARFAADLNQHDFELDGDEYVAALDESVHGRGVDPVFQLFQYATQGEFSTFSGTVAAVGGGQTGNIEITADFIGTEGDDIVITGDGATNVNDLLDTWNLANPENTATATEGGFETPDNMEEIQLAGGVDPAGDKTKIFGSEEIVNAAGDISIAVAATPTDERFDGRIVVI